MQRILVCGGRYYNNKDLVYKFLNAALANEPIECIISGMATGADTLGIMWAKDYNIKLLAFPANWNKFHKIAGFIRNQQMINEGKPTLVFAFPGGKGTKDMCKRAKLANIVVIYITDNNNLF